MGNSSNNGHHYDVQYVDYCKQEERITRLEERQSVNSENIVKLQNSMDVLNKSILELNKNISLDQGKAREQDFVRGYLISFVVSLAIIIISRFLHL
jgi:wobble nucleotide-excising tRNase